MRCFCIVYFPTELRIHICISSIIRAHPEKTWPSKHIKGGNYQLARESDANGILIVAQSVNYV